MNVKETIDDVEFDELLRLIKEEKESDTYVKKAIDKAEKGITYGKVRKIKGESLSPDVRQWRIEHDKLVDQAQKIKKPLMSGMGDKDKIASALKEFKAATSRLKALRKQIDKNAAKTASKPEALKTSRLRKSAAETEAYEKKNVKAHMKAKKADWKERVKMAKNFNDFSKRSK